MMADCDCHEPHTGGTKRGSFDTSPSLTHSQQLISSRPYTHSYSFDFSRDTHARATTATRSPASVVMMPTTSTAPKLPAELLLAVLSHLQRHDLAQVSKVNSYLRSLARPFFYRFGTLTKFGLYFPGAPRPYPSLDLPQLGFDKLSGGTLDRIASSLKVLDLPVHEPTECTAWRNLKLENPTCTADVLRIYCGGLIPSDPGIIEDGGDFPHTAPYPLAGCCEHASAGACECGDECYTPGCEYYCPFRSVLVSGKFGKVVLRNAPVASYEEPEVWLPFVERSNEFVAVIGLRSDNLWSETTCDCDETYWGVGPFCASQMVTVVVWTGASNGLWRLPCEEHQSGQTVAKPGKDGYARRCDSLERFWTNLGAQIGYFDSEQACHVVRIVNAQAIYEEFVHMDQDCWFDERPISSVEPIKTAIVAGANNALPKSKEKWEGQVQFLSMEEWVALGEWEDVFTRKEMEPFLKRK